ncbi:MAG: alpha/beta hydrolase family protein [Armatimonadota bacterium]|nr:alpha/beta hydrolase family protein [Armatimonadota bacterium]
MESLSRFPRVMQEFLVRRVRAVSDANRERIMAMRSEKAALEYQEKLRTGMRKVFGRKPRRTPLESRIVGSLEREGYRVEKIIFESRPNLPVTANLYVPDGLDAPAPAVLGVCGHSVDGKACDLYQSFSQGLVRKGYVVLIFDPLSQGERMQYPDGEGGSVIGPCTREHNWMGRQQILCGEFFGSWRVWDGIRALDYLLEREEVDPERVGLTGNSGGGTMTTLLLAATGGWSGEDRFTMAAPSCYITTWRCNTENELPADAEQQPPFSLSLGMEMGDLLMLHAPRPLLVLGQELDYFDARGLEDTYERLRHFWGLFGAEDNVELFIGPRPHGYHVENREAMYGFFNKHAGVDAPATEPELELEDEETLWSTESGQVDELKPATVFDFTRERSEELAEKRGEVSGDDLLRAVEKLLNLPRRPPDPPHYRILRPLTGRDWPKGAAAVYLLETDPEWGAHALVYQVLDSPQASRPQPGDGPAVLWLPHQSSDEDLREDALCKKLAKRSDAFFTCDYRGIGELRPETCNLGSFEHLYGSDYFYASYGLMLGEPYVSWRVHDVLRTLDFMAHYGYDQVHLVGREWGAIPAAFAALLDERVVQVTLRHAPISYREMAETAMQQWPLSAMLPYVLEHFDLPDVYRALADKDLTLTQPRSAEGKRMQKKTVLAKLAAVGLDEGLLG